MNTVRLAADFTSGAASKYALRASIVIAENFLLLPEQNDKIVSRGIKFVYTASGGDIINVCSRCLVNT